MTEKLSNDSVNEPEKKKRAPYKTKTPSRGGAREGAGRKKGVTNKVSYVELLEATANATGMSYAELVANEIVKSIAANDTRLTKDYLDMIGKKSIADKSEMDITSNGETIKTSFTFSAENLSEWRDD
jgi:hypothetical protein